MSSENWAFFWNRQIKYHSHYMKSETGRSNIILITWSLSMLLGIIHLIWRGKGGGGLWVFSESKYLFWLHGAAKKDCCDIMFFCKIFFSVIKCYHNFVLPMSETYFFSLIFADRKCFPKNTIAPLPLPLQVKRTVP